MKGMHVLHVLAINHQVLASTWRCSASRLVCHLCSTAVRCCCDACALSRSCWHSAAAVLHLACRQQD